MTRTEEKIEKLNNHQCRSCKNQPNPWCTCGYMNVETAIVRKCNLYRRRDNNVDR